MHQLLIPSSDFIFHLVVCFIEASFSTPLSIVFTAWLCSSSDLGVKYTSISFDFEFGSMACFGQHNEVVVRRSRALQLLRPNVELRSWAQPRYLLNLGIVFNSAIAIRFIHTHIILVCASVIAVIISLWLYLTEVIHPKILHALIVIFEWIN